MNSHNSVESLFNLSYFTAKNTPASQLDANAPISRAPLSILIAEDEKINQHIIVNLLNKLFPASEVVLANNGQEALQEVVERFNEKRTTFDIIILDDLMPVLEGSDAAKQIRKFEEDNHLSIAKMFTWSATYSRTDEENRTFNYFPEAIGALTNKQGNKAIGQSVLKSNAAFTNAVRECESIKPQTELTRVGPR